MHAPRFLPSKLEYNYAVTGMRRNSELGEQRKLSQASIDAEQHAHMHAVRPRERSRAHTHTHVRVPVIRVSWQGRIPARTHGSQVEFQVDMSSMLIWRRICRAVQYGADRKSALVIRSFSLPGRAITWLHACPEEEATTGDVDGTL